MNNEQISWNDLDDLLNVIAEDMESTDRSKLDLARMDYDTPFYDGNLVFGKLKHKGQTVCFGETCFYQGDVNYIAQGIYSAYTGQSIQDAKLTADVWNIVTNFHKTENGELFWMAYGYHWYQSTRKK